MSEAKSACLTLTAVADNGRKRKPNVRMAALTELGVRVSPREFQVLVLLAQGQTNERIARQLDITQGTLKQHCKNIFRNNGWTSREQTFGLAEVLGVTPGRRTTSIAALVRSCRNLDVTKMSDAEVRRHLVRLVHGLQSIKRYDYAV